MSSTLLNKAGKGTSLYHFSSVLFLVRSIVQRSLRNILSIMRLKTRCTKSTQIRRGKRSAERSPFSRLHVTSLTVYAPQRALPPGLSARDAKILKSVQRRAHYLDKGFSICGVRFGWTFLIGLIPMAGDVADASLNYFLVVRKARQAECAGFYSHMLPSDGDDIDFLRGLSAECL
jgi:Domain of unknown function (DUF4112)